MKHYNRISVALVCIVAAAFLFLPVIAATLGESFYVTVVTRVLIFAIAATALNLVFGYGGLVSLGHALFFGLGAYSVAIPALYGISNGFAHLAICLVSCFVAAAITGAISLRTTGIGFIMITLAFAQMGFFAFVSLKQFGGDDGTPVSVPSTFGPISLDNGIHLYYVTLAILVLAIYAMAKIRKSGFGMVLRSAKENARRSGSIGFHVNRFQWKAYVISGTFCGVAGLLIANLTAFASPANMSWFISAELIVMVVLGGAGTVLGPVVGTIAFMGLEEFAKHLTEHWAAVVGLVVIAISLAGKKGIVGLAADYKNRMRGASTKSPALPIDSTQEVNA